ncbi:phage-related protein, tail component [Leptolyngbya sp. PCC 7375]|nr:phage-related protein, tail component [Leptolyngbya sp. PCC 7375]
MPDEILTDYLIKGSGGGGCFVAGTDVWTPSGTIPIESVEVGQSILAFDYKGKIRQTEVLATHKHESKRILKVHYWGGSVTTTPNHWFYVDDLDAFQYAGKLNRDAGLKDRRGGIRPVEYINLLEKGDTVYNLQVKKHHTFLVGEHGIRVHNGGGGKSGGSPNEEDVTALSRATIKIIELVSEGPIEGFKAGQDIRENIFLDDTPVRNADGSLNFSNYQVNWRPGSQTQTVIPGFGDEVGSEVSVGQDITVTFPITRQIINNQIDAIRVRLGYQLQRFEDDGDITGESVNAKIFIKQGNGPFVLRLNRDITSRFESLTEYDYYFPVNTVGGTVDSFTIRVESNSPDTADTKVQRIVRWQSYTEVIEQKLNYPHSAIIAQSFAAEQFNSVPSRSYFVGGVRCRIPTNSVVTEDGGLNFSGSWNMGLYRSAQAVSDPAWQLLELLTNERFGLGNRISLNQISLASLYEVSVHNNQIIPDGFGGVERRYLCNTVMQSTEDAHDQIQLLLNACNARYYWGGDKIYFWQDRPGSPISQVTNANVTNGTFTYASTDIRSRNSICNVVWNDPGDNYRRAMEPVDVTEAIDRYGIRQVDITAPGCTSRGQAVRAGRRKIYTDLYETETCTFSMAIFGIKFRPGDIIEIYDWKKPNQRYAGLVLSGTTTEINLDAPVVLPAGATFTLQLTIPTVAEELRLHQRAIANSPGTHQTISVTTPFPRVPTPGATWSINVIAPKLFRVLGMRAKTDNESVVEIVAGEYYDQKQNLIETGFAIQPINPPIRIPSVVPPPKSVGLRDITVDTTLTLDITWVEPTDSSGNRDLFVSSYQYQYKRGIAGAWSETRTVTGTNARLENLLPGTYYARVASVYLTGGVSAWKESAPFLITDINLYFNYRRSKSAIALV